ncbi:hypothetical protein [Mycobacterium sp. IS-1496]|uniref:hypothetical protein n=1 Tax=Mycobacterium sp. IS-1496 TaxID=1772284 RepID=UPI0012FBE3EC|nr:hypothetical protein [Mycobacterium sp. IS-1496]
MRDIIRTRRFAALVAAVAAPATALVVASPANARCTDQFNYSQDTRSNAEINSIGATTGVCPTPMRGNTSTVQGLVQGATLGRSCANFDRFRFGKTVSGDTVICNPQGDGTGLWVRAIPVIGTRLIGSSCQGITFALAAQSPDGIPLVCSSGAWVPN